MNTIGRYCGMRKAVAPAMFILGFILLSAWNCYADSGIAPIGGEYFIVGTSSCVNASGNQDFLHPYPPNPPPDFVLPDAGGTFHIAHYQGTLRLNGMGAGTLEYYLAQYHPASVYPGNQPFSAYQTVEPCDVVYEELPNRLNLKILEGCHEIVVAGFREGNEYETGERYLTFESSMNGDLLLLSKTRPTPETTTNIQSGKVINRLCSRTLMAVRVDARR